MQKLITWGLLMGFTMNFSQGCSSQGSHSPKIDRQPAVAGQFYPADSVSLRATLAELFSKALPRKSEDVRAIISPHAGYVYSGIVAASSFNQIDPNRKYDNIFILASSHQFSFFGASIYNQGDYITPLGKVKVNLDIANQLIRENKAIFSFQQEADRREHSLEVQLPFLQFHMKTDFKIVPILLGTQSDQTCNLIASALKPYFTDKNLFIISTDFSHYPSYQDAQLADKATCDAILSNLPENLKNIMEQYKGKNIPNLATNICGWTSAMTLLYITADNALIKYKPVQYLNSGDSKYGDKTQVVGYWSIVVESLQWDEKTKGLFQMDDAEKLALLKIARNTLKSYIPGRKKPDIDTTGFTEKLKMHAGAFVTLKQKGNLRGCIGRFTADIPLYRIIQEMTIASSTQDSRFDPVSPGEVDQLEIEISVLSPMQKIKSIDEIILGRHGIYLRKNWNSGTFLPQVALETAWTKEEFLGHCARDKAGIGWDGWKSAEIFIYEACVFSEHDFSGHKY